MNSPLQERFSDLLQQHVHKLTIRGNRATGLSPCHEDRSPSFSADLERCIWFCHACGLGGGVRAFAELVGEPWENIHHESGITKAHRARFRAEREARAILERRAEEQHKHLCAECRERSKEVEELVFLLSLFHRRPDLAEEFSDLATKTEKEYGEALFQLSIAEARLDGEVE